MPAPVRFVALLVVVLAAAALVLAGLDAAGVHPSLSANDGLPARVVRLLLPLGIGAAATLAVVRWSVGNPVVLLADWVKALRSDVWSGLVRLPARSVLAPLVEEISKLARSYHTAKDEAAYEAHLRGAAESVWTPQRLAQHCRAHLDGHSLVVVANREPYIHMRHGREIRCLTPASGLVSGIEPILLACGGTWVAHGSGTADRDTVDEHDRTAVPPGEPRYTLRRVWLGRDEEAGFYYGFANEGLWPLCHVAHTRPAFRPDDWSAYRAANERFCQAVLEELGSAQGPWVLIQDYHFTLLPRLIKASRPDARIALFWHIPWPNAEAFGICPWQHEILDGMLGADVIGFHTPHHCRNFLETVDRVLESRVDWARSDVVRGDAVSRVRAMPISVPLTDTASRSERPASVDHDVPLTIPGLHRRPRYLAVGVDRLDYTKGIPERFQAIERLLERVPRLRGDLTCVQLGAPSRGTIARYRQLEIEVTAEAERINARFRTPTWQPIVLLARHHDRAEITPYYRHADLCLVTSLHDGMNLVAKEFVAAREDEDGVLVLSQFTGAAHELREALVVNPYDIDQTAGAILRALEMSPAERRDRMRHLRRTVMEHNTYRWAADLIREVARVPTVDVSSVLDMHFQSESAPDPGGVNQLVALGPSPQVTR